MSHPMWVRGLKRAERLSALLRVVAPYVGAWIETDVQLQKIEDGLQSHPMWVRGLKHNI